MGFLESLFSGARIFLRQVVKAVAKVVQVAPDGRACQHRVPIETFPQAFELLRRHEGHGIIKG